MKKILLLLVSITFFMSCDVESLDRTVLNNSNNGNGNGNTSQDSLALSSYSLDENAVVPILGPIITNSDFSFNANNKASNIAIVLTVFGQTSTENVVYLRDNSNRITGFTSMSAGVLTNETTVIYSGDNISQIVYDFAEDDEEDYTYNFTYSANTITRTEAGSTISTIFTLDSNNQVVKKESFDGTNSIKKEILDYDGLGNCIASVITGEDPTNLTFVFDTKINPLKAAFSDQFLLSFLNDDYSDVIGTSMAQFTSTNNWKGFTASEGTINFTNTYDTQDRIKTRNSTIDIGGGSSTSLSETYNYVN